MSLKLSVPNSRQIYALKIAGFVLAQLVLIVLVCQFLGRGLPSKESVIFGDRVISYGIFGVSRMSGSTWVLDALKLLMLCMAEIYGALLIFKIDRKARKGFKLKYVGDQICCVLECSKPSSETALPIEHLSCVDIVTYNSNQAEVIVLDKNECAYFMECPADILELDAFKSACKAAGVDVTEKFRRMPLESYVEKALVVTVIFVSIMNVYMN